ncbi:MAG: PD-(D/E)XK nuclease domain-containing protein [Chitinispirillales bacterium]|nr:PD-(D/E)XK nuclease domain-containing protein [Chitinispirillales bacterium]
MLPPEERLVGAQLHRYIRDKLYWVLHAPRQTGKTTFLQSWAREINSGDEAVACYVSIERCQGIADLERGIPGICEAIIQWAGRYDLPKPSTSGEKPSSQLSAVLESWSALVAPKPLIVLFDETDVLEGETLISFLRQLRDGFAKREAGKFPVSIALVGMKDLKDYITQAKDGVPVNPGSPFNIKEDSTTIGNFNQNNVKQLFAFRTEETGQKITNEALDYVWEQSRGQPWIVNSLFKRATMRVLDEDSAETVTLAHVTEAREQMILARETHLDALAYRMENPKIRKIIESLIVGKTDPSLSGSEDFRLCLDLGLVTREKGTPSVANPIYREILARQLTIGPQDAIPEPDWQWEKPDGTIDMDALLKEFQKFWRRHSEIWEEKMNYTEAFPHLLLMAFLQRVLNGGGHIDREYAAGRGRMDLAVEYKNAINIIEIKLIYSYDSPAEVREEGLRQITKYRDKINKNAPAYLVIFDRRPEAKSKPWDEKLGWENESGITIVRC